MPSSDEDLQNQFGILLAYIREIQLSKMGMTTNTAMEGIGSHDKPRLTGLTLSLQVLCKREPHLGLNPNTTRMGFSWASSNGKAWKPPFCAQTALVFNAFGCLVEREQGVRYRISSPQRFAGEIANLAGKTLSLRLQRFSWYLLEIKDWN